MTEARSLHRLLRIVILQAVQALTDLYEHILNTCTVLLNGNLISFNANEHYREKLMCYKLRSYQEPNSLIFEYIIIR